MGRHLQFGCTSESFRFQKCGLVTCSFLSNLSLAPQTPHEKVILRREIAKTDFSGRKKEAVEGMVLMKELDQ